MDPFHPLIFHYFTGKNQAQKVRTGWVKKQDPNGTYQCCCRLRALKEWHLKPTHADSVGVLHVGHSKRKPSLPSASRFDHFPFLVHSKHDTTHHLSTSQIIALNFSYCTNSSQMRCPFSINAILQKKFMRTYF